MAKSYLSAKSKCTFPIPDKSSFRDNARTKDAIKGFEYWQNLPPAQAQIARVRVYRLYPPIDLTKIGEKNTSIEIWEGPIPFRAEDYQKEFFHRFGSGEYKCLIEEQGLSGVVCDIWFSAMDLDNYPPKLDDRTLMLENNRGQEYAKWRARIGDPVAGDIVNQKSEDDFMTGAPAAPNTVAATVVGGMIDVMKDTVSQAREDAKEERQARIAAETRDAIAPNPGIVAANGAVDFAFSSAAKVVDSVMTHAGGRYDPPDPVKMTKELFEIFPKPDNTMVTLLMDSLNRSNERIAQLQTDQMNRLSAELAAIRNAPQTTAVATNGGGMEELKKFQEMASLLGYNRNGSEPSAPQKSMAETMQEWQPIIQMGLGIAQQLVTAWTAPKVAPAGVNGPPPPINPAVAAAAPPPHDTPQQQMLRWLQKIEKPFLSHLLSPDYDGITFAQHILTDGAGGSLETADGRAQYRQMRNMMIKQPDGTIPFDTLIRSYPPIWERAKGDLPSYQKFLAEFFNYDEQMGAEPPPSSKSQRA